MSDSTVFSIQKKYLSGLASWLAEQSLGGKESRERTRFVQVLSDELKKIEDERKDIVGKYVEKEENGDWKKVMDNGTEMWVIPDEKKAEMEKEYADLMEEEYKLDVMEGNKSKIQTARDIVLNTDYKFGPREGENPMEKIQKIRQAAEYDKWCEAFESLAL